MSKKPVADLMAVLDDPKRDQSKYVAIGPIWYTEKGTLSGSIETEPVAWKDPTVPRAVIISPRPGVTISVKDDRKERSP